MPTYSKKRDDVDIGFEVILPKREYADIILPWVNDRETLHQSFHQTPREPSFFFEEFTERYFTSRFPPLFILFEGRRVGYLRFKEVEHPHEKGTPSLEISLCIAPLYRGKGIATEALIEIQEWLLERGCSSLVAEVKKENSASLKAFLKAGFKEYPPTIKTLFDTQEKVTIIPFVKEFLREKQNKVFLVAEAGSNWKMGTKKRDISLAKALIEVAKEAGVDAVKFQTYSSNTLYVKNAGPSHYLVEAGIEEDISSLIDELAMPYEMLQELSLYARTCGIEFMSTPFSERDFDEVDPFVRIHKIASYENGHPHLIKKAAASKKPLFLSTGATTLEELEWAISYYKAMGGENLTLLQCTAKYPAAPKDMNLAALLFLKERFHLPVGLSDHSLDPLVAPLMATALGASVIEKHFTLSNRLPGPDHAFALMPAELKEMVKGVRKAEEMRGSAFKSVQSGEEELRLFAKRGLQALKDIEVGAIYKEGTNFAILRPGNQQQGIHPRFFSEIEGKKAKRRIESGSGIIYGDW